ncbi:pumilio 23 isoform X1 [Tasmannia lanceolata]|uniref:pumilio 23 isoform X1 n=1 Tax=Tasmannia lanceolata TaxID=3420 RepID=UPI0040638914
MTSFGSKALKSRRPQSHNLVETSQMAGEDNSSVQNGRKQGKNRRPRDAHLSMDKDHTKGNPSRRFPDKDVGAHNSSKHQNQSMPQKSILRKTVDPETTRYFSEIANMFESGGIDLEERPVVCGNALEETRGKELELATDTIISHILQTLLQGCDVEQLCGFLLSCTKEFPFIAMDKSGSHVAETSLKSLAVHLQDNEAYAAIDGALTKICQVIAVNSVDVMCSRYGSHVLRSLLCLCKGIPLDSLEGFHITKSSSILSERLNSRLPQPDGSHFSNLQQGFPHLLKFLVREMLICAKEDIATLQVNKYSSFVLQTALKLLMGDDQELLLVIPIILGSHSEDIAEAKFIETTAVPEIKYLLKDTAYSHLMEVILEVAPKALYNQFLTEVFRGSLFEISSHHCGSFVVQALVSSAKSQGQMDLIWGELGPKMKELLEIGKHGVVASLLAACQRLHTYGYESCRVLAAAVCSESESPSCIVPRILFLESYFFCEERSTWKWTKGYRMHTLGCLMLQTIFRYSSELIQSYITSITSIEPDLVFEAAKDAGGGRVVESFLSSDASAKQKQKLIATLRGHFGELSMLPSGSFTVEKCFTASNVSVKEMIASELLAVQSELSKTKHGPFLLKKLDVDGFAMRPDQWKSRQASKQTAYREFVAAFGSESKKSQNESFLRSLPSHVSTQKSLKKMREEIDRCLDTSHHPAPISTSEFSGLEKSMEKLGFSSFKRTKIEHGETATKVRNSKKFMENSMVTAFKKEKPKGWKKTLAKDEATPVSKAVVNSGYVQQPAKPANRNEKRRTQTDCLAPPLKKQKR